MTKIQSECLAVVTRWVTTIWVLPFSSSPRRARLGEELKGKTQIVVTQRVTTAKHSDCIFVMDRGCLVDWGRHEELLPRCQVYREIYVSQTGGDAA